MWGVIDLKVRLKVGPVVPEKGGREGGGGRGRVRDIFNEVKITTDKGIYIIWNGQKKRKDDLIEVEISRLEINVKDLEWQVCGGLRSVAANLSISPNKTRQGEVIAIIKLREEGGVNYGGAGLRVIKTVPGNVATWKVVEGKGLVFV